MTPPTTATTSDLVLATPSDARSLGTVLGIWAHPDDEAYLAAGLMALVAAGGGRVVSVTATSGEHGTDDPSRWPPRRLARVRRRELAACMAVLGVDDHRVLGFEDGTLASVAPATGTSAMAQILDEVAPDTIVTFGPDGMTGHPDHRTVSTWVGDAWERSGSDARLLWATTTASFAAEFADIHAAFPVFADGLPLRTAEEDIALSAALDDALLDRKLAALRSHASQTTGLIDAIGEDRFRAWWRVERFRRATP